MGKYIAYKWKSKESWSSNVYIGQIDFKIKTVTREQEGHCIMIKGSRKRYENLKYICISHSITTHKVHVNRYKQRN